MTSLIEYGFLVYSFVFPQDLIWILSLSFGPGYEEARKVVASYVSVPGATVEAKVYCHNHFVFLPALMAPSVLHIRILFCALVALVPLTCAFLFWQTRDKIS